jgi:hypothetical protein
MPPASFSRLYLALSLLTAAILAGCGSNRPKPDQALPTNTQFSRTVAGSGEAVCWDVKRAFLSQGYMLDRTSDSLIMIGTKDEQKDDKTDITLRLQTTCVDNKDGTSTIFATANREVNKLENVKQSQSMGVWIATVTVPSRSEQVMHLVRRETVTDLTFYNSFYDLVEAFVKQEKKS